MDPKQAQQARSKKYGIAVRDGGNITKPSEWVSVPDEDWLDPVNYAYPCPDAKQTASAAAYWGREKNKNQYSQDDQAVIDKRLAAMEKKFKMGSLNHSEWIPIMKTGKHTDSNGVEHAFDEARLDHIAASYDPTQHEAPEVIGHPEDNAPAWGWVESLKRMGDMLYYKARDRAPEFTDMLKKKLFKKRSLSLYPDGTLRHVGWLGAVPPAVKGLPDVAFSDKGSIFEFEEFAPRGVNRKEKGPMKFFEWLKGLAAKEGVTLDDLPQSFSEADVKAAKEQAAKEAREKAEADFAEERKKKDAEFKGREDALRKREADARTKGITEFCEALKKQGRLIPAMDRLGMGITAFMQEIGKIEAAIEFGEEGKKEKQTPLEFMQKFLAALPPQIEFKEVASGDKDVPAGDEAKKKQLIASFMEANKNASYKTAVLAVSKEHPELFKQK